MKTVSVINPVYWITNQKESASYLAVLKVSNMAERLNVERDDWGRFILFRVHTHCLNKSVTETFVGGSPDDVRNSVSSWLISKT